MKIKDKLKFIVPSLIVILLTLSYFNFRDGVKFNSQVIEIDTSDKKILQELKNIKQIGKLDSIENNIKKFFTTLKNNFSEINIKNIKENSVKAGIDKVGEFRDFIISTRGDMLNQINLFTQINKTMRSFVVINSIDANNTQMELNIRIYGRTNNEKK